MVSTAAQYYSTLATAPITASTVIHCCVIVNVQAFAAANDEFMIESNGSIEAYYSSIR
jgi:hypothetical protein